MKRISTHVLDLVHGSPANEIGVRLEFQDTSGNWQLVTSAKTGADGRCAQLLPEGESHAEGVYRLVFDTASYFAGQRTGGLYPFVEIAFQVRHGEEHFHIPLLLSPNGYTTYRGS